MTDVVIVGAGLGGTSAAMFLARQGVQVLVVEKHAGTSPHPRAAGQFPRTMEFLRIGGVAERILAAAPPNDGFKIKVAESVRGKVLHTIAEDFSELLAAVEKVTPAGWGSASQDQVEPILLDKAREHGADVRFGTELTSFEQDADGVNVQLLDLATGRVEQVRAKYLIAADGNRSQIRERLGIPRTGKGNLGNAIGIVFDADLSGLLPDGETWLYYLQNPKFTGAYVTSNYANRHIFALEYHPEQGESMHDYPPERLAEFIRIGLDSPDLEPEIVWTGPWETAAKVAERWRAGRVFLVGDAGKVTPPTGGMGGNAAVCDGYDIAWKLGAVLRGEAGDGLLDTYEAERKPYAQLVVNESLYNYVQRLAPHMAGDDIPEPVGHPEVVLGYRSRSTAVVIDDDDPAPVENPFEPSARPGFHAPHAWLAPDQSTVDLFGDWQLFTGPDGYEAWQEAAKHAPIDVGVHSLGEHADVYGVGAQGASLVRPDGVVAWRTTDTADGESLNEVLRRVLSC
ncbi:aklavinone 12-hydroxylase RdmE [Actinocrispum wychmicini]|uniref:Aklavinone 12-hydroxylase n=1 Tax=Actinocrispum wychmicini TaxID=1213861 RepID=A0A4V2S901_9PSEU|nr:FAD-dependent oxidoreductase [Actinocrispum wychmicini]TCO65770.1 aklavinone 12-hydroxylase [Actinocrispum wychmicini]